MQIHIARISWVLSCWWVGHLISNPFSISESKENRNLVLWQTKSLNCRYLIKPFYRTGKHFFGCFQQRETLSFRSWKAASFLSVGFSNVQAIDVCNNLLLSSPQVLALSQIINTTKISCVLFFFKNIFLDYMVKHLGAVKACIRDKPLSFSNGDQSG